MSFYPITMETFTLRSEEQLAATTRLSNPSYDRYLYIYQCCGAGARSREYMAIVIIITLYLY
jgi:hypothetical protein